MHWLVCMNYCDEFIGSFMPSPEITDMTPNSVSDLLFGEATKLVALIVIGIICIFVRIGHYKIKAAVGKIFALIIPTICFPLFLMRPRNPNNIAAMSVFTAKLRWWFGIEHEIRGTNNMSGNRNGIVVMNHQNVNDALVVVGLAGEIGKLVPIMKRELLPLFPFGPALWLCGAVFISRKDPKLAYKSIEQSRERIFGEEGTKIVFFPEGTRNFNVIKTKKLLPFKKGAFRTAIACQAPIFPVVNSPYYFYNKAHYGKGKIITKILPPIETNGLTEADVDSLVEKTAQILQDNFDKLYNEVMGSLPKIYQDIYKPILSER